MDFYLSRMRDIFTYNAETGDLTWKARPRSHFLTDFAHKSWNGKNAGRLAGTDKSGRHVRVGVNGDSVLAHRIIWEMHNGPIPDGYEIDHRDLCPNNNRLSNLRLATPSQNRCNTRKRSHNTTGLKGVFWDKSRAKWVAYIGVNGTQINLGRYITKGLAAVARAKATLKYHGQFARV